MGLDMFVLRVQKPSLDADKVYDRAELKDYAVFLAEEADSNLYRQAVPFAQKLRVVNHYYDLERIRADHNMPDAEITMLSPFEIGVSGKVNGVPTTVTIASEQVASLYTLEREEECFVFARKEVAFWRKAYDLQEQIYNALGEDVENTGFYLLNEEAVDAINCYGDQQCPWSEPTDTSALFYWEWY